MYEVITKNVLGQEIKIFAGPISRWAWTLKCFTKDCHRCPHCIDRRESVRIVKIVAENKGKSKWQAPPYKKIMGICNWGALPKILCFRERLKKCEYFGKPPSCYFYP